MPTNNSTSDRDVNGLEQVMKTLNRSRTINSIPDDEIIDSLGCDITELLQTDVTLRQLEFM